MGEGATLRRSDIEYAHRVDCEGNASVQAGIGRKSGRGLPHSRTLSRWLGCHEFRQVLECGGRAKRRHRFGLNVRQQEESILQQAPAKVRCKSSADFQSAVSQASSASSLQLTFREKRCFFGLLSSFRELCRLEIGDTAGWKRWKPALPFCNWLRSRGPLCPPVRRVALSLIRFCPYAHQL
jgi:hypothetical protein